MNTVSSILDVIKNKITNNIKPNISNKLINMSLTKIMSSNEKDLLRIIFSKNSIEHSINIKAEASAQISTQIIAENVSQTQAEVEVSRKNRFEQLTTELINFKFNPLRDIKEFIDNYIYSSLTFNNTTILFSYNLFNRFFEKPYDTLIIIKLLVSKTNTIYLFENAYNIEHYVPIAPIYNKYGIIVNDYIFNNEPKRLNIKNIFNISFINNTKKIDFGSILFNIEVDKLEQHRIEDTYFEMLSFLIYQSNVDVFNIKNISLDNFIINYEQNKITKINFKLINKYVSDKYDTYIEYIKDYIRFIPFDVYIDSKLKVSEFTPDSKIFKRTVSLYFNHLTGI